MIKEKDMEALIKSLERGNVQMVNVKTADGDVKVFIEANPQYKSISVYDSNMKRLNQDRREQLMNKSEMNAGKDKDQSKNKEQQQSLGTEGQGEKKASRGRKASSGEQGDGLVKKNRTRGENRGMGVH
jgi:hypothetical protein